MIADHFTTARSFHLLAVPSTSTSCRSHKPVALLNSWASTASGPSTTAAWCAKIRTSNMIISRQDFVGEARARFAGQGIRSGPVALARAGGVVAPAQGPAQAPAPLPHLQPRDVLPPPRRAARRRRRGRARPAEAVARRRRPVGRELGRARGARRAGRRLRRRAPRLGDARRLRGRRGRGDVRRARRRGARRRRLHGGRRRVPL